MSEKELAEELTAEFSWLNLLGENQTEETFNSKVYASLLNLDKQGIDFLNELLETLLNIDSRTETEDELCTELEKILEDYDFSKNLTEEEITQQLKGILHERYANLDELADALENIFGQFIKIENITKDDDELKDYNLLTALNNSYTTGEIDYNSEYVYIDIYALKNYYDKVMTWFCKKYNTTEDDFDEYVNEIMELGF